MQLLGVGLVPVFGFGELVQQLADGRIAGGLGRLAIEARGFVFHLGRVFAHFGQSQRPHQPQRLLVDEARNILATDQR